MAGAMTSSVLEQLRLCPLFARVSADDLRLLANAATCTRHPGSHVVFRQGETADHLYIVLSGQVVLSFDGEGGVGDIAKVAGPGVAFGESCVLGQGCYQVTAKSLVSTELIVIERRFLCEFLQHRPDVVLGMLGEMSFRLRALIRQIMDLKMKSTAQRLGTYLVQLTPVQTGAFDIRLPYEKKLLASELGMQPETLSRAFLRLQGVGVRYQKSANVLKIRDVAALRAFCESGETVQ
jgi:CRP-like cAMP-binding protein